MRKICQLSGVTACLQKKRETFRRKGKKKKEEEQGNRNFDVVGSKKAAVH